MVPALSNKAIRVQINGLLFQGCTNPVRQVTRAPKYFTMARNICGSSVRNLLFITFLAPRILRYILDFYKICKSLFYVQKQQEQAIHHVPS